MAVQNDILESYYPSDVSDSTLSSPSNLFLSLHHPARQNTGLLKKLFLPSAGALYVYRPSKRRRVLNRAVEKIGEEMLSLIMNMSSLICTTSIVVTLLSAPSDKQD